MRGHSARPGDPRGQRRGLDDGAVEAATWRGVLIKLYHLLWAVENTGGEHDAEMVRTAIEAVERLSGAHR